MQLQVISADKTSTITLHVIAAQKVVAAGIHTIIAVLNVTVIVPIAAIKALLK